MTQPGSANSGQKQAGNSSTQSGSSPTDLGAQATAFVGAAVATGKAIAAGIAQNATSNGAGATPDNNNAGDSGNSFAPDPSLGDNIDSNSVDLNPTLTVPDPLTTNAWDNSGFIGSAERQQVVTRTIPNGLAPFANPLNGRLPGKAAPVRHVGTVARK